MRGSILRKAPPRERRAAQDTSEERWNGVFYNALQDRSYPVFIHQLLRFAVLAGLFIVIGIYQLYVNQWLQIRWRRWLTDRYLGTWMTSLAYYRLELAAHGTDTPDQRIADDVRLFVDRSLALSLGGLNAVVTLASFAVILWELSGDFRVPLGATALAVPGSMLWLALVYALVGTWITTRIGRPLAALNYDQQRLEADFRVALVRLRDKVKPWRSHAGKRTRSAPSARVSAGWSETGGRSCAGRSGSGGSPRPITRPQPTRRLRRPAGGRTSHAPIARWPILAARCQLRPGSGRLRARHRALWMWQEHPRSRLCRPVERG
jgi:hypothetical protein